MRQLTLIAPAAAIAVLLAGNVMAEVPYRQTTPIIDYGAQPHVSDDRKHTGTYEHWKDRAKLNRDRVNSATEQWTTNWKFMDEPYNDTLHGGHEAEDRGRQLFTQLNQNGSFAACLGAKEGDLTGLRANHYPQFNRELGKVVNLEMMIEHCASKQGSTLMHGSYDNSAISVYVATYSNGMPINIDVSQGELKAAFERGKERFHLRTGRLNMGCASCHVSLPGQFLRGQGLTTHYGDAAHWPTYRTKNEMQSLHVRFTECNRNGGTQPLQIGAKPYVDIEVFLNALSNGYPVAVPSARD
ncbi:MAG: sulfur oxidation c-type cytochrome SoxA [Gammaproteobacteria bacterium]|nr:sulfur oxidation c-type cytochrome SoxA [Gammaproteobacteria bacterium]